MKKLVEAAPDWSHGECIHLDPDEFFMEDDDAVSVIAEKACNQCEIRVECLHWASENDMRFGYWGGTTPRQRRALKRPLVRIHCPGCASEAILEEPTSETCLSCGLSWRI